MNNVITTESPVSQSIQRLLAIVEAVQQQPYVQTAVLCTADGLPIYRQDTRITHIAAVAGFLLSAAKQSSNMLGRQTCQEIVVQLADDSILVCHPFMAGQTELILTLVLTQKTAYKRLITHTTNLIREAVEE